MLIDTKFCIPVCSGVMYLEKYLAFLNFVRFFSHFGF